MFHPHGQYLIALPDGIINALATGLLCGTGGRPVLIRQRLNWIHTAAHFVVAETDRVHPATWLACAELCFGGPVSAICGALYSLLHWLVHHQIWYSVTIQCAYFTLEHRPTCEHQIHYLLLLVFLNEYFSSTGVLCYCSDRDVLRSVAPAASPKCSVDR